MLEKALKYIVGLNKPEIMEFEGEIYSDKPLERIDYDPIPSAVKTSTLTSVIDYINKDVDYIRGNRLMIHVVSPTRVEVRDFLNRNMSRCTYMIADADVPFIPFDKYVGLEEFKILLASCFEPTELFEEGRENDREILMNFVSNVQVGTIADYGDDGISQKAVVSRGIASKEEVIVPSPVTLCPYRSFHGIPQTKSEFIFRLKEENGKIYCALFEADGGAWKNKARMEIAAYLQANIREDRNEDNKGNRFNVLF